MGKRADAKPCTVSDEQIIELYMQRSENAIRETEAKYGKMLFRVAYNILHNSSDCEECKNDTYLGVWNAIPPARPAVFPAFITQIMRNIAANRYKEKNSLKRPPAELALSVDELADVLHGGDTTEAAYTARELGRLISDYLRTLSARQRYIFIGRFYMAETLEHLAGGLGVGVATVCRDIEKIKRGLKCYLEENGVNV